MAVVNLIPYDDRGREIIGELEESPQRVEIRHSGPREYYLRAENVGWAGFVMMLDRIDSDWRKHLGQAS